MKKVVFELPEQYIWSSGLNDSSHVGFIDKQGHKGFISYTGNGRYMAISMAVSFGTCNYMMSMDSYESLRKCVKKHNHMFKDIFLYNTREELFLWLSL